MVDDYYYNEDHKNYIDYVYFWEKYLDEFGLPDTEYDYTIQNNCRQDNVDYGIHYYPNKPDSKIILSSKYLDSKKIKGYELDVNIDITDATKEWLKNNNVSFYEIETNNSRGHYFLYDVPHDALECLKKRFHKFFNPKLNPYL